jgi:hypothetical protein
MNNRKFSATMGTRLVILMLALLAALAALAAGQALSAQPAESKCPQRPCKPVSEPVRQPTETGSDERRSQNVSSSVAKRGSPDSAVHRKVTREEAKRAQKYWTEKRMANAIPVSSSTDRPGSQGKADQPLPTNSSSRPVKGVAPVLPSDHPDNGSRRSEGSGVITPYQASGLEWTGPSTRPPATVNGVLFFRREGSSVDLRCSASTVNSDPKNLVFTAGACVHQGSGGFDSGWYTNVVFVPGYRNGSAPYDRWYAKERWTNSAWANSADQGYNYGAVVFYPNAGRRLVDVVGANGMRWNEPVERYTYTFGYPSSRKGKYAKSDALHYCSGTPSGSGVFDPRKINLKCDFPVDESGGWRRGDALGGPWVKDINSEEGWGYLHSITTEKRKSGEITGIRFDDALASFYNAVSVRY